MPRVRVPPPPPIRLITGGPLRTGHELTIQATPTQTNELRQALAVVDRWKKRALAAVGHKEKDADWTMVGYAVKTDRVIITVESGACG